MDFEIKLLIDRLNPQCRRALEASAGLCVAQTHFSVELEHLLVKLLETSGGDIPIILRHFDVDPAHVGAELMRRVDRFKRGNARTPTLSPRIAEVIQEAWLFTTLKLGGTAVRSGALLLAMLQYESFRGVGSDGISPLAAVPRDRLALELGDIVAGSSERSGVAPGVAGGGTGDATTAEHAAPGESTALGQYTIDLTEQARAGAIDPIIGRDREIRQIVDILTRRRQNNPILTGEAGVGKTAVVEGFALRVVAGDVPPALRNVSVRTLDLGLLQAGASMKGEFENRLKNVIAEVKSSPVPVILFIDEAHTMVGAGGGAGQNDAANLLKPALARGELRTIAATTWSEYKKYFEKDPALTRRFQVVKVDEPEEEAATNMLRALVPRLEAHHAVRILDEAVREAVRLSNRYISARQLPDKAISVLDTACARVAIAQNAVPPQLEEVIGAMTHLELELDALEREQLTTRGHAARIIELTNELDRLASSRAQLEERWERETALVEEIGAIEARLAELGERRETDTTNADIELLAYRRDELEQVQQEDPMVHPSVDASVVAAVIAAWTGIPVGRMITDDIRAVLTLESTMAERIIGQNHTLASICRRIRTSRADLLDPGKPVGVFLLVGPSGVGKTETAVTLAEILYGGERNMVVVNMSEYQEAHTVSALKGAPPGYVGYGQGGVLTEAVRRHPYSVVLLDEVEKAHPDVMELFYQVFDKGRLEDGEGVEVDFKNTIILLTSNIGSDTIMRLSRLHDGAPSVEELVEAIRPQLVQHFKPALLGRMVVVPYLPLGDAEIRRIVRLKLARIERRFTENHRAELVVDDEVVEAIAARCTEVDSGARTIDHILTNSLLPELSSQVLERIASASAFWSVRIRLSDDGSFDYRFVPPLPLPADAGAHRTHAPADATATPIAPHVVPPVAPAGDDLPVRDHGQL